jgi:hypothetical protein
MTHYRRVVPGHLEQVALKPTADPTSNPREGSRVRAPRSDPKDDSRGRQPVTDESPCGDDSSDDESSDDEEESLVRNAE